MEIAVADLTTSELEKQVLTGEAVAFLEPGNFGFQNTGPVQNGSQLLISGPVLQHGHGQGGGKPGRHRPRQQITA